MANVITYKDKQLGIGDTIAVDYKIKEGEKERIQVFEGILIKIRGCDDATRMITVRKISKIGLGVERILPLNSPFISNIKVVKTSNFSKAKLYFIRGLSQHKMKLKLYHSK